MPTTNTKTRRAARPAVLSSQTQPAAPKLQAQPEPEPIPDAKLPSEEAIELQPAEQEDAQARAMSLACMREFIAYDLTQAIEKFAEEASLADMSIMWAALRFHEIHKGRRDSCILPWVFRKLQNSALAREQAA
jgi:hypothetical protein